MRLTGGISNRNRIDCPNKLGVQITHHFNNFELEHITEYSKNNLYLFAASTSENKISPNGIYEDVPNGLVISGEIRLYNTDELIDLLKNRNFQEKENPFQLVLALYLKFGHDFVKHLNGDFSFVIWNETSQELYCARDQMGQRPFYYHIDDAHFMFSTHINGVAMHSQVNKVEDETWVLDYLQKKISFTDKTIYKEIQRLPPAHYLIVTPQKNELTRYWKLEDAASNSAITIEEAIAGLKLHIERAVKERMHKTTKIGAELSGGLDSSAIASIAQHFLKQKNGGINAYTNALPEDQKFTFDNFVDEWDKAVQMVDFSGIEHHFAITTPAKPILELINYELKTLGYPTNFSFTALQLGVFLQSKAQGDEILFSGFGGDELVTEGATGRYPFSLLKEKHYFKLLNFFQQQKGIIKGSIYTLLFLKNFIQNKELKYKQKLGLERWKNILLKDENPCYYLYRQIKEGNEYLGIIACTSIDDYISGIIKIHEQTITQREEKLKDYLEVCEFNAEPVLFSYPNDAEIDSISDEISKSRSDYDFTTTDKVRHTVWVIDHKKTVKKIAERFIAIPSIYIADGHHRSASSTLLGKLKRTTKKMDNPKNHKKALNKKTFSLLIKGFEPVFEGCFF